MKKIIARILFIAMLISMVTAFVGCSKDEEKKAESFYLEVSDNKSNSFKLTGGGLKEFEYEYEEGFTLRFDAKAYYTKSGQECLHQVNTPFSAQPVKLDDPGTHELVQSYSNVYGLGTVYFKITVRVKQKPDTRPIARLELFPREDCIEYEMNKRYVFKYDGTVKQPGRIDAYEIMDNQQEGFIGSYYSYGILGLEILEGDVKNNLVDVGKYKVNISLRNAQFGNDGATFQAGWIEGVIIEIIE